jgi:hypothetical protein
MNGNKKMFGDIFCSASLGEILKDRHTKKTMADKNHFKKFSFIFIIL